MSADEIQEPVWKVTCDLRGCAASFEAELPAAKRSANSTRLAAEKAGWDVPPWRGQGSRRGTDFCPEHSTRTDGEGTQ